MADATASIWDAGTRTDHVPRRASERPFDFFNRLASPRGEAVRSLVDAWVAEYPSDHRPDIVGRLQSGEVQFEGAFWELYLHEVFRRAGYSIVVHPATPAGDRNLDFLVTGEKSSFFVEARMVEGRPHARGEAARLNQVYDVLREFQIEHPFVVSMNYRKLGARAPSTKLLRQFVTKWLASLDHAECLAKFDEFEVEPSESWVYDDWEFELTALPLRDEHPGPHPALCIEALHMGPDIPNHRMILDALADKASAYGDLHHPLVIALLCNTAFRTGFDDVEWALYGRRLPCSPDPVPDASTLQRDGGGFWVASSAWQRHEVPQVITASRLGVTGWSRLDAHPVVWPHPDPKIEASWHPPCFATATLGSQGVLAPEVAPADFLDLPVELVSE